MGLIHNSIWYAREGSLELLQQRDRGLQEDEEEEEEDERIAIGDFGRGGRGVKECVV